MSIARTWYSTVSAVVSSGSPLSCSCSSQGPAYKWTKNAAGRSLRHLVIWAKANTGMPSARGTDCGMTLASLFGT